VISNGKVKTAECMKHSITANDLMFKLRAAGIYEIKTVKRAVFEQNGQLSIIQYGDDNLRYPLIVDGQLDDDVLDIIDRDEEWVKAELEKQNITIEQVYIGEYLNGQLVAHVYENK
jgi:raw score 11.87